MAHKPIAPVALPSTSRDMTRRSLAPPWFRPAQDSRKPMASSPRYAFLKSGRLYPAANAAASVSIVDLRSATAESHATKPWTWRGGSSLRSSSAHDFHVDVEDVKLEVRTLKQRIVELTKENAILKTQVSKSEKEISKKDRTLDELLMKNSGSHVDSIYGNATPTDKIVRIKPLVSHPDKILVNSLRLKCLRLEQAFKDKDMALRKLRADLKATQIEELRTQLEIFYNEILRLQHLQSNAEVSEINDLSNVPQAESAARIRSLAATVQQLKQKNETLLAENKLLRMMNSNRKPDLASIQRRRLKRNAMLSSAASSASSQPRSGTILPSYSRIQSSSSSRRSLGVNHLATANHITTANRAGLATNEISDKSSFGEDKALLEASLSGNQYSLVDDEADEVLPMPSNQLSDKLDSNNLKSVDVEHHRQHPHPLNNQSQHRDTEAAASNKNAPHSAVNQSHPPKPKPVANQIAPHLRRRMRNDSESSLRPIKRHDSFFDDDDDIKTDRSKHHDKVVERRSFDEAELADENDLRMRGAENNRTKQPISEVQDVEQERKLKTVRQKQAARVIQRNWKDFKKRSEHAAKASIVSADLYRGASVDIHDHQSESIDQESIDDRSILDEIENNSHQQHNNDNNYNKSDHSSNLTNGSISGRERIADEANSEKEAETNGSESGSVSRSETDSREENGDNHSDDPKNDSFATIEAALCAHLTRKQQLDALHSRRRRSSESLEAVI